MSDPQECSQPVAFFAFLFIACFLLCGIARAAPSIALSRKSGPPTSKIVVSGAGFEANVGVDIFFGTQDKALVVTDGKGEFHDQPIYAPRSARPGEHWITALERNSDKGAQKMFLVQTDWRQFHFDADGTRLNPFENVLNPKTVGGLNLRWSYATDGRVDSSPAVANGVVYVGSNNVYALNASTGARLWRSNIDVDLSSPTVANGVLYVGSYSGKSVYALNAETGATLWSFTAGSYVDSSLTMANGIVYVGSDDGNVYALNAVTGANVWSFTTGGWVRSSPVVANGIVYVGSDDHNLYALNASTGAKVWTYTTGGEIFISAPVVADGVVYACSIDHNVYALDAATGTELWSYDTPGGIQASPAVANGVVYAGANSTLYALNARTGAKIWGSSPVFYSSSPAVANGVVYIGADIDQTLYALKVSTGAVLWSYSTGSFASYASPVVANGMVYTGSDDGTIYAFGLPRGNDPRRDAGSKRLDLKTLRPDFNLKVSKPDPTRSGAKL